MKQILPGLFTFTGLRVGRVYLTEDADGLTLIDASLPGSAEAIVRQLEAAGRKASDVRRILITHAHPDHIGGLPKLKALTGAEVIASPLERPVVEGKMAIPRVAEGAVSFPASLMRPKESYMEGTPVDRAVSNGDRLTEVMGGMEVLATPGHAPGHVTYWQPDKRVAFCGDVMMHMVGLRLPFAAFTVDMQENKRSIRKVTELNPALLCFGHGEPLGQNTAEALTVFAHKVGAMSL